MGPMKRFNKNSEDDAENFSDLDARGFVLRDSNRKCGLNLMQLMGFFVLCLMLFSVLFSVSVVLRDPPSDGITEASPTTFFQAQKTQGITYIAN